MFSTKLEIQKINDYFKTFVLEHRNAVSFDEILNKNIIKIETTLNVNFHNNWEYLMTLTLIIEKVYNVQSIVTEDNYFRFELTNDERIQDKGSTKIEALFSCCYQVLEKYNIEKLPYFNRGSEPFDLEDFDEKYNDEGFKELGTKEYFKTLNVNELVSMLKVTKQDNPSKLKLIMWLESEINKRK